MMIDREGRLVLPIDPADEVEEGYFVSPGSIIKNCTRVLICYNCSQYVPILTGKEGD